MIFFNKRIFILTKISNNEIINSYNDIICCTNEICRTYKIIGRINDIKIVVRTRYML